MKVVMKPIEWDWEPGLWEEGTKIDEEEVE